MLARLTHATPTTVSLKLAQSYLKEGRQHKEKADFEVTFILYDQAKVSLIKVAGKRHVLPLAQVKDALRNAQNPAMLEDHEMREHLADIYFERGEVLKAMGDTKKAEASYQKAKTWGHVEAQTQLMVSSHPSSTFGSIKGVFLSPLASSVRRSISPSPLS